MRVQFKKIFWLAAFCCFILIESCKNSSPKTQDSKNDSTSKSSLAPPTTSVAGPFAILKLDKQNLINVFADTNTKKLLIQFSNDSTNTFIQAIAFGVGKKGVWNGTSEELISASTTMWDTTGLKILGNNELTKKQIKTLIGGPIGGHATDLYFYPMKDSTNHIVYVVSTSLIPFSKQGGTQMSIVYPPGSQITNPSPPAPPCDDPNCYN